MWGWCARVGRLLETKGVVLLDNTYDASNALDGFRCPPAPGYALYEGSQAPATERGAALRTAGGIQSTSGSGQLLHRCTRESTSDGQQKLTLH